MIFRLYTVYNKRDDDKNWRSNQRKIESIIASARIILLLTVQQYCGKTIVVKARSNSSNGGQAGTNGQKGSGAHLVGMENVHFL